MGFIKTLNRISDEILGKEAPPYARMITDVTERDQGISAPSSSKDYQDLMSVIAAVYRAVFWISSSIAQLPIQILRTANGETEDIIDKPEFDIFRKYNSEHTKYDFWEQVIGYLELTGESPWVLERTGGKIIQMFPFRPDLIKIFPHNEFIVDHYEFFRGGKSWRLENEDVFFLKYFNPTNPMRGLSPISSAKIDVTLELHAITSTKEMFKQGSRPSGFVSTEQELGEPEWKRYTEHFKENYAGTSNAGKVIVAGHGMKYKQISLSAEDMQFSDIRRYSKETISEVYGVPPIFLMQWKDASVLANADIQYKLLWDGILPKLRKLEEIFTVFLLPQISSEKNLVFKFDTSGVKALQKDMKELGERYNEAFKSAAVSPNEIRTEVLQLEKDDDPAMDMKYIPSNMIPVSEPPPEKETPFDTLSGKIDNLLKPESMTEDLSKSMEVFEKFREDTELNIERIKTLASIQRNSNKYASKFAKKLQGFFDKQKQEVLLNLGRQKFYSKFTTSDVMFDFEKWSKKFASEGEVWIAKALKDAGKDLSEELGEIFTLTHPDVDKFVNTRSVEYANMVNTTTKEAIDKRIKAGLAAGSSIDEIASQISSYFKSQGSMRATRIARTEMVRAINQGRLQSMKQSKKVTHHAWASQRDEMVRDSHSAVDGVVVEVGKAFPVGAGYNGNPTYPSDINERCGTLPIKKKK